MVFYEVEIKSAPTILFACSVEYEKYQNEFHCPKDYLEISVCEKGRTLLRHVNGEEEMRSPKSFMCVFSDCDFKTRAYKGERQAHTTVGVNIKYDYKKYSCEQEVDLIALSERLKTGVVALLPYSGDVGELYDELLNSIKQIAFYYFSDAPSGKTNALSEWYALLGKLTEFSYKKICGTNLKILPSELMYAMRVAEYIDANYMNKFTVRELAEYVGLSEGYLHRLFKRVKGVSIVKYTTSRRIAVATEIIRSKGLSLKEASFMVGIDDPSYMSRLFKKVMGRSYREIISKGSMRLDDED